MQRIVFVSYSTSIQYMSPPVPIRRVLVSLPSSSYVSYRIVTFTNRHHFSLLGICQAVRQRLYSYKTITIFPSFRFLYFDRKSIAQKFVTQTEIGLNFIYFGEK